MTLLLALVAGVFFAFLLGGAAYAGFFIKRQGDSDIVLTTNAVELPEIGGAGSATVARSLVFRNVGKQEGVLLDVRVSARRAPGILVEPQIVRKDTHPSELGYWVANILMPGESCEGELTVQLSMASPDALTRLDDLSITVSFDEVGRGLLVTKTAQVKIVVAAVTGAE